MSSRPKISATYSFLSSVIGTSNGRRYWSTKPAAMAATSVRHRGMVTMPPSSSPTDSGSNTRAVGTRSRNCATRVVLPLPKAP